jgi:hypothetical protein
VAVVPLVERLQQLIAGAAESGIDVGVADARISRDVDRAPRQMIAVARTAD